MQAVRRENLAQLLGELLFIDLPLAHERHAARAGEKRHERGAVDIEEFLPAAEPKRLRHLEHLRVDVEKASERVRVDQRQDDQKRQVDRQRLVADPDEQHNDKRHHRPGQNDAVVDDAVGDLLHHQPEQDNQYRLDAPSLFLSFKLHELFLLSGRAARPAYGKDLYRLEKANWQSPKKRITAL